MRFGAVHVSGDWTPVIEKLERRVRELPEVPCAFQAPEGSRLEPDSVSAVFMSEDGGERRVLPQIVRAVGRGWCNGNAAEPTELYLRSEICSEAEIVEIGCETVKC